MPNNAEQVRARFEAQATLVWGADADLCRNEDGSYRDKSMQDRWEGCAAMLDFFAIDPASKPMYEAEFQEATAALVIGHIDRMNDVCEQDTADCIVESFTTKFRPILETYFDKKFPVRAAEMRAAELARAQNKAQR